MQAARRTVVRLLPRELRWVLPFIVVGSLFLARMSAADASRLIREALVAETKHDSRRALELLLAAEQDRPNDAFVLQKIAQQYSDLTLDLSNRMEMKRHAETALRYAQRAATIDPSNAVNVLSVAVCYGKLASYSDTRLKIEYSRRVREETQRAIALNPRYAWAHHLLGRWHHEVAALGGATKWFVRVVHGGLPPASTAEAVSHLLRATELEPDELSHRLELGFAYMADRQFQKARTEFARGLAMPSIRKHDAFAKDRARQALAGMGERRDE